jgi:hypothetical protein
MLCFDKRNIFIVSQNSQPRFEAGDSLLTVRGVHQAAKGLADWAGRVPKLQPMLTQMPKTLAAQTAHVHIQHLFSILKLGLH